MINPKEQAHDIVQLIVLASGTNSLVDISEKVEERIKSIASHEYDRGYSERRKEEIKRHEKFEENLLVAKTEIERLKNKIAQMPVHTSDK